MRVSKLGFKTDIEKQSNRKAKLLVLNRVSVFKDKRNFLESKIFRIFKTRFLKPKNTVNFPEVKYSIEEQRKKNIILYKCGKMFCTSGFEWIAKHINVFYLDYSRLGSL